MAAFAAQCAGDPAPWRSQVGAEHWSFALHGNLVRVRKGVFFLEQYDNEDECCITAGGRAL
jgi:hypothetical protein